jgi:hypothetical protein
MVEPNEVLPEPSGRTYSQELGRTVKSVLGNSTLASLPIASVFMFNVRFSWI